MLEILKFNEDEYTFPCLIVLGCFDGMHIGHTDLLKKAKLQAKINGLDLGVMMFSEGKGGKQVYTFEERVEFLEQFNVKFVLKIDFNDEFKKIKPLDFLQAIEEKINVKAYMSGKDFKFGAGAKGKSSTLKSFCEDEENGVWYMPVKDVTYGEQKISTSYIKTLLEEGDIKTANELLGRNFSVTGKVINGADRGGKLIGIPTMNLQYPESKIQIKQGVYAICCKIGESVYNGVANYGARPTFGETNMLLEVHLIGYNGENYDTEITVEFLYFIREIATFECADALKQQLIADINGVVSANTDLNSDIKTENQVLDTAAVEELAAADGSANNSQTSVETADLPNEDGQSLVETANIPEEDGQTLVETAEDEQFEAELEEDAPAEITEQPQTNENEVSENSAELPQENSNDVADNNAVAAQAENEQETSDEGFTQQTDGEEN